MYAPLVNMLFLLLNVPKVLNTTYIYIYFHTISLHKFLDLYALLTLLSIGTIYL